MSLGSRTSRDRWVRTGLDVAAALTKRRQLTSERTTIGIFLLWGIGDAVLTTPFLHALRNVYPGARIVAIGKPWLADLFAGETLFDEFVACVPPWTRHSGKYRLWSSEWRTFARDAAVVRRRRFDLLISLRPDPRETALARVLAVREFAGYALAGGRSWISIDLGRSIANEPAIYRGALAGRAAEAMFGAVASSLPSLCQAPDPDVAQKLIAAGYTGGPILALAFGAAHPVRRWSASKIAETLAKLHRRPGAYVIIDSDDGPKADVPAGVPILHWRGALADLKRALTVADVLFCADSGPLHVGTALGCSTVSIFGAGSRERFAPRGTMHAAYAVTPMPCRPCHDNCIYSSPRCMDRIDTSAVAALVDDALARISSPRITRLSESAAA